MNEEQRHIPVNPLIEPARELRNLIATSDNDQIHRNHLIPLLKALRLVEEADRAGTMGVLTLQKIA